MADGIQICPPDDPNRCQSSTKFGQCNKLSLPGRDRCKIHKGPDRHNKNSEFHGYQLAQWHNKLEQLGGGDAGRSLRAEIGILKMSLESLVARCHTADDLVEHGNRIMALSDKINQVVVSCHRLEKQSGMMLDKAAALQMAGNIVTIISDYVEDAEAIEAIADRIIDMISSLESVIE